MASGALAPIAPAELLSDLRELINNSRQRVAQALNAALVLLYWQIGQRIRVEILKQKRADYGERIVHALSAQLAADFGSGFGKRNLFNMVRFAEVFPDREIVHALSAQLGWTHLRQIMRKLKYSLRDLYRTLEEPGDNPLRDAQARLDAAVRAAYGMSNDADPLAFLLELNLACAAKEKTDEKITPPGVPLPREEHAAFITDDCIQAPPF